MGVGMLRRYHTQTPDHVNEPTVAPAPAKVDGDGSPAAVEPPAGNASQADWADWVLATRPDLDEAEVRAMGRDKLREQYGPE